MEPLKLNPVLRRDLWSFYVQGFGTFGLREDSPRSSMTHPTSAGNCVKSSRTHGNYIKLIRSSSTCEPPETPESHATDLNTQI